MHFVSLTVPVFTVTRPRDRLAMRFKLAVARIAAAAAVQRALGIFMAIAAILLGSGQAWAQDTGPDPADIATPVDLGTYLTAFSTKLAEPIGYALIALFGIIILVWGLNFFLRRAGGRAR